MNDHVRDQLLISCQMVELCFIWDLICERCTQSSRCLCLPVSCYWLTALFPQLMWKLREGITEGLLHDGYVFKYDISLPHSNFYAIIPELKTRLPAEKVGRICGYGHVGRFEAGMNIAWEILCLGHTSLSLYPASVLTSPLLHLFMYLLWISHNPCKMIVYSIIHKF